MKKILVISLIALLAPVMVFAADPAASAGAKSGSAVMGGVSAGTVAAGTLAVAVVGAAVLSNGGDGSSSASGINELPADVQASIEALYASLSADQKKSFDYIVAEAGSVQEVQDVLSALEAAIAAGATQAEINTVFANTSKDAKSDALSALEKALYDLRGENAALYSVVKEFITGLDSTELANFAKFVSTVSDWNAVAQAIKEENGGSVAQVTPTHTVSNHFTVSHHTY